MCPTTEQMKLLRASLETSQGLTHLWITDCKDTLSPRFHRPNASLWHHCIWLINCINTESPELKSLRVLFTQGQCLSAWIKLKVFKEMSGWNDFSPPACFSFFQTLTHTLTFLHLKCLGDDKSLKKLQQEIRNGPLIHHWPFLQWELTSIWTKPGSLAHYSELDYRWSQISPANGRTL